VLIAQLQRAGVGIDVDAARVEAQFDVRMLGRRLEQHAVQPLAADRMDHLALVLAIGQELQRRMLIVQHAAGHGDHLWRDAARQTGMLECDHATRRQREIDRAATHRWRRARIGASLDEAHALTAPREHQAHQGSNRTGADNGVAGHQVARSVGVAQPGFRVIAAAVRTASKLL